MRLHRLSPALDVLTSLFGPGSGDLVGLLLIPVYVHGRIEAKKSPHRLPFR